MAKRVFVIVLDSFGVGELPDAADFGDEGSNTLGSIAASPAFDCPSLQALGLFNIEGTDHARAAAAPRAAYCRIAEASRGKDTTIGHWEIAGVISPRALPTYPNGFPAEVIAEFERRTGKKVICNLPYSGTDVLDDYGEQQRREDSLIVYTSADSVFQIAANEEQVPVPELYRYCEIARELLQGEHGVGRIIARPYVGGPGSYRRTANRHDYSLPPPQKTVLDFIGEAGQDVIGVGKIYDIFAGAGVKEFVRTESNQDGMDKTLQYLGRDFHGLCFVNLVDFDMVWGHRNNIDGYANCATEFDRRLTELLPGLRDDDLLIITADHGCDPGTPSTDHSREYIPMLAYGKYVKPGVDLGTRGTFADIAATVADYLGVKADIAGESFLAEIIK